jgi:outer membrane protein TolC
MGISSSGVAQLQLSLQDAVDSAMVRSAEIKQYQSNLLQKELANKSSTGLLLPKVDLVGGYSYFSQNSEVNMSLVKESIDDVAGKYGAIIAKDLGLSSGSQEDIYNTIVSGLERLPAENIIIDQQNFPNLSLNILQPIFTGGKLLAQKRVNQTGVDFAQIELEVAQDKVRSRVTDYYLKVQLLTSLVKTRKEILDGLLKHEDHVQKSIKAGILPPHEVMRVQVLVANAERDLDNDSSRLVLARLSLRLEMGFDDDVQLVLTDSLAYKPIIVDLKALEDNVENTQSVFKVLDVKTSLLENKQTLNRSGFYPEIGAYANFSFFREQYPVVLPPAIVGVQLKWNLFNGFSDYHKTKSNQYAFEEIKYSRQNADKEIKMWMNRSYLEAENFNRQFIKSEPTEKLAKKNLDIMHKRFTEGLGTSIDVLDAELMYSSAKTERQMSLYLYYVALNQLYMAAGEPEKLVELLSK